MTGCVCPEPGFCQRHGCKKTPHLHRLCQTRDDYFELWESGKGPGQAQVPHTQKSKLPPLHVQSWNLATSLASFVADGFRLVSPEEYKLRLVVCDSCDHRHGNRCGKCGCNLSLKARGRAFKCPKGLWGTGSTSEATVNG